MEMNKVRELSHNFFFTQTPIKGLVYMIMTVSFKIIDPAYTQIARMSG